MQEQELSLIRLFEEERPRVHCALERAVELLPAPVREIGAYVLLAGGKRLRPLLTLTASRLLGRDDPGLYRLCAVPEMIHAASLLHDDILDEADTRRGRPSAHTRFGLRPALLAGDAMLALADCEVTVFGKTEMVECVSEAMMRTVAGDAHEIARQGSCSHGEAEYVEVVTGKTGWLLRASCRLGALYAGADPRRVEALSDFGLYAGIAFQMVDDALDFADAAVTGKPCGGDLREGKFTPPIMRYAGELDEAGRAAFGEKFASGSFSDEEIGRIAADIRERGHDAAARSLADEYLHRAEACLALLPEGPELNVLREVIPFIRDREK